MIGKHCEGGYDGRHSACAISECDCPCHIASAVEALRRFSWRVQPPHNATWDLYWEGRRLLQAERVRQMPVVVTRLSPEEEAQA